MKTRSWMSAFLLLLLTACSAASASPTPLPTVVLDPSGVSAGTPAAVQGTVTASSEAVPAVKVSLSFPLTGLVKTVDVKVGDEVQAGQALAALDTTILEARVNEAGAKVASTETRVRYLHRTAPADEQLNAAIADVDGAKAVLAQMEAMLAQAVLTTPIGGTVISVDIAPGETAVPGRAAVLIADLDSLRIETTDLSERDVALVQEGQPVTVFIQALNAEFPGTVTEIARTSGTLGGDVVFKVTIELNEQPEGLRWGMSADVIIQVEE